MHFFRRDGQFGVVFYTGPTYARIQLCLVDERIDDVDVSIKFRCPVDPAIFQRLVLEGTDRANEKYGTSHHPWSAMGSFDDNSDDYKVLRRAAFAIVEQLAVRGETNFANVSPAD